MDALNMDLIGMTGGYEKFQTISKLPIFLDCEVIESLNTQKPLIKRVVNYAKNMWDSLVKIESKKIYLLVGGSRYFKLKNPTNERYF